MSTFDEKHTSSVDTQAHPLGHSAAFKADDVVHSDKVSVFEDKSFNGDDNEEFPFEEHQFTW